MIQLDGAGGGGQILRTALSLSMITGKGFRMVRIRGKRKKGGLKRQHLTCVKAAVAVSDGSVDGAQLHSTELVFQPGNVRGGGYKFAIGTAGSTTLLAQTLLPPLWLAKEPSSLFLEGGTHNPMAPSADYLTRVFLPLLQRFGAEASASILVPGFAPAGGGQLSVEIEPTRGFQPVELLERGAVGEKRADCMIAHVPEAVAEKELSAVFRNLGWPETCGHVHNVDHSSGPGNLLELEQAFEHVTERVSSFGALGKSSERVATVACNAMRNYLDSGAVVGLHLADQLLLPMALAGGGAFVTLSQTNHLRTNIDTIQTFLDVRFQVEAVENGVQVRVARFE